MKALLNQFGTQYPEISKLLGRMEERLGDQLDVFTAILAKIVQNPESSYKPLKRMADRTAELQAPLFLERGDFDPCRIELAAEVFLNISEEECLEEETQDDLRRIYQGRGENLNSLTEQAGDLNSMTERPGDLNSMTEQPDEENRIYFEFSDGNTGFKVSGTTREEYQDAVVGAILTRRGIGQSIPEWAEGNNEPIIRAVAGIKYDEAVGSGTTVAYGTVERKAKNTTFGC